MANPPSLEQKLLQIKEYSDLTVQCDGGEFKVHRAYLCAQSPVIAAALRGDFMEAKTGILKISYDVESVRRFLEFVYSGAYHVSPDPAIWVLSASETPQQQIKKSPSESDTDEELLPDNVPALSNNDSDHLLCHGRMNAMADYYDVPSLAALSITKAEEILTKNWDVNSFTTLVENTIHSTSDAAFHDMLGTAAAEHIDDVIESHILDNVTIAQNFGSYVLRKVLPKLSSAQASVRQLQQDLLGTKVKLQSAETYSATLHRNMGECQVLLQQNKACRNVTCSAEFTCHLEYTGNLSNRTIILRCSRCKARHEL
ncbi:hypothetical protein GGS20DRAFT_535228 [Poronia punctata]|nr:hypothetical protein GGS20DRAFT_535228 [Poronia punctata]